MTTTNQQEGEGVSKITRLQELSQEDSNEASKYLVDNLEDLICESLTNDTQPTYTPSE